MLVVALIEKHVLAIVDELTTADRPSARRRRRKRSDGFVRRVVIGGRRRRHVPRQSVRLYPVLEA
jgi:hypothetical protein